MKTRRLYLCTLCADRPPGMAVEVRGLSKREMQRHLVEHHRPRQTDLEELIAERKASVEGSR